MRVEWQYEGGLVSEIFDEDLFFRIRDNIDTAEDSRIAQEAIDALNDYLISLFEGLQAGRLSNVKLRLDEGKIFDLAIAK